MLISSASHDIFEVMKARIFSLLRRLRLKIILIAFTILATLLIILFGALTVDLHARMTKTLAEKSLLQPTEFFSEGLRFSTRKLWKREVFEKHLNQILYRSRQPDQILLPGDYLFADRAACEARAQRPLAETIAGCLVLVRKDSPTESAADHQIWIFHDLEGRIAEVAVGARAVVTDEVGLEARRFAQYLGSEPLMQENVSLPDVPAICLHALLAIEDQRFLEHSGFSATGLARAVLRNVAEGRKAQGGSTITQQLVKNYFLTSEKSYERKIKEIILAVLLETRFSKDEILETYLNVIYMGQFGAFRVHGYASASRYYFSRPLDRLSLPECALMAALVNNPGGLNPWRKPEAATKRRALVLKKMLEQNMISADEEATAAVAPLPAKPSAIPATETAPYFIDAVRKQVSALDLELAGLRIETSLDLDAQQLAQESLQSQLERLETSNKHLKALAAKKKTLEGVVLSADVYSGLIQVAVGGRNFRKTQYNRAVESRRQVGSVMKPLVYLTGLSQPNAEGEPRTPTTVLKDEKHTYRYEGQRWTPENYDRKFRGEVPLFAALKDSLNAPTVALGMEVGLENIITTARSFGIESNLKPVPSLTLGAFEMTAPEVLRVGVGLAAFGRQPRLSFIRRIRDARGEIRFEHSPEPQQVSDPVPTAELVGIMKQAFVTGTAASAKAWGFTRPAAGKTGTTSGERDTWFMGFTPSRATVVWVGFDDGGATKLTGASGALPVWATFMNRMTTIEPDADFAWPEGTELRTFDQDALEDWGLWKDGQPESLELVFPADD